MRERSVRRFIRACRCVALAAALLLATPALADDYKIGVHARRADPAAIDGGARPRRTGIEQEFKARDADIARKEQDVAGARPRSSRRIARRSRRTMRASRERALDLRTRDVQRLRQQFAEDLRARQFEELDKLKERLDQVLTQLREGQPLRPDPAGRAVRRALGRHHRRRDQGARSEIVRNARSAPLAGQTRFPRCAGEKSNPILGEAAAVDRILPVAVPRRRRMPGPHERIDERLVCRRSTACRSPRRNPAIARACADRR